MQNALDTFCDAKAKNVLELTFSRFFKKMYYIVIFLFSN